LDGCRDGLPIPRASAREVRLDLLVVRELDEEVHVLGPGATDADAHRPGSTAAARALVRANPDPSATPSRISARPPASAAVSGSPRKSAPKTSAVGGRRYVTSEVRAAPCRRSMRKRTSCAAPVPRTPRAAAEPSDFQPGAWCGSCTRLNGSVKAAAATIDTVASAGPAARESRFCA